MEKIFRYKKSIDNQINHAVEKVLRTEVLESKKMKDGEINHVYKIKTKDKKVIARIFQYPYKPENGKLKWIEKHLTKRKIPHAKLLYYSRDKKYFPNGFMITEFIEGIEYKTRYSF